MIESLESLIMAKIYQFLLILKTCLAQKLLALKMSKLENLLGASITEFPKDHLATLKEVLQFYSQYWSLYGSDSLKEKLVAAELIQLIFSTHFG